jgi:hypothetical protein
MKKRQPIHASLGSDQLQGAYPRIGVPLEDFGFRRLTEDSDRDLNPMTQDRMHDIAFYLYRANSLAKWMIETTKNFVLGEGVKLAANDPDEDKELQELLDELWYDPINNFSIWQEEIVTELGIFGELIWPAFVNEYTGHLRLGYLDPVLVQKVVTDPDNARIAIGIIIKKSIRSTKEYKYRIIYDGDDEDLFTKRTARLRREFSDGDCFYHAVNKVSSTSRGVSDLLDLFDWLDGYDQFLFDMNERAYFINSFVWDVLLKGADEATIRKWHADNPPPKRGSVRAHNENVTWEAVAPDLKFSDTSEGARLLRNHILGGAGFPEHWFGGGGDVNRSTSESMGDPAFKRLEARQKRVRYIFESVADYQISKALEKGRLKSVKDPYAYSVIMPEMVTKDLTKIATVIQTLGSALVIAQQEGWIDTATARKIFSIPMGQLGAEIDLKNMDALVAEDQEKRAAKDYLDSGTEGSKGSGGKGEGLKDSGIKGANFNPSIHKSINPVLKGGLKQSRIVPSSYRLKRSKVKVPSSKFRVVN